jgi:hypothetical protein
MSWLGELDENTCFTHFNAFFILTKQAQQKDLAPWVLALSISRTGDRRPKDSGGANHHYKTCKEIRAKKLASKSSIIQ